MYHRNLRAGEKLQLCPSPPCLALHFRRYKTREIHPLSSESKEPLGDLLLYKTSWGCLFHFICAAVKGTVVPTAFWCMCVIVVDLAAVFRVCVLAVKVCEPDGGCGQKQRIVKVHVTVTLCFLRDKDVSQLPFPFCPHFLPLIPPLSLPEVISLPPLPLVSPSVSPLLISVIPSISLNFYFTPFLSLSFGSSPESPALSPYVSLLFFFFFPPADRHHFSVISIRISLEHSVM